MPTAVTRFEVELPFADFGSPIDTAVQNFKTSMRQLCDLYETNYYKTTKAGAQSQSNFCSGYLLSTQTATALGYLNTLNSAIIAAGGAAVLCSSWGVNEQP